MHLFSRFFNVYSIILSFLAVVLLTGCSTVPKTGRDHETQIRKLQQQLVDLGTAVDPDEAKRLANASVEHALALKDKYRVVRPPWIHNFLVNNGIRERGLCFEWTNDLFEHLYQLRFKTVELHLAVARMDTRREHNALLVTERGAPFKSGVILDAWRSSGHLWFGRAADDKYPWVPLPADRVNPKLQELINGNSQTELSRN
jgi:hypothetical protein